MVTGHGRRHYVEVLGLDRTTKESVMQPKISSSHLRLLCLFLLLNLSTVSVSVNADHVNLDDLLGGLRGRGNVVTRILRHFITRFRQGLAEARVGNLTISDIDGSIACSNFYGDLHTRNNRVIGLSDFKMSNLSTSVAKMELHLDLEIPVVEFAGTYYIRGTFAGFIPVWGGGSYSVKFPNFRVNGSGQMQGRITGDTSSQIKITDPSISVGGIQLEFDGLLSRLNTLEIILIVGSIVIVYTVIVVVITIFSKRIKVKVKQNRKLSIVFAHLMEGSSSSHSHRNNRSICS